MYKFLKKQANKTYRVIKYLSTVEWMCLFATIGLTIGLPFALNIVFNSEVSYALSTVSSSCAIIATLFVAKGRRIGIIIDVVGITCIGINLLWFSPVTQPAMGFVMLLFVLPAMFVTFYIWGKNKKQGIVEGKKLSSTGWWLTFIAWGSLSLMFFGIKYSVGGFNDLDNIELTNAIVEMFAASATVVLVSLYIFAIKEFWTWWMIAICFGVVVHTTSYMITSNPVAVCSLVMAGIEIFLASWGLFNWNKK